MKKLIAVVLSLLVVCTAFAFLVSAADEGTTKDPFETDIPQVITNIAGDHAADHQKELGDGLKFFRTLFEKLTDITRKIADAFDKLVDALKNFSPDNLFDRITDMFKR
ncbi:MAG: hypothetical protein II621_06615 [Clostridia bacterium]|nr:hypothetical protein [Clostridia bacterium]